MGAALLALGNGSVANAQEPFRDPGLPFSQITNCYPAGVVPGPSPRTANVAGSGAGSAIIPVPTTPPSSTNGAALTPRGNLKVLVIFAGFNEGIRTSCGDYTSSAWSQVAPAFSGLLDGETLPANYPSLCYTNPGQFSLTATDQSLSNYFYQMSRTSPNPFRVTFGTLPRRVNVPAAGRGYGDILGFGQDAINEAIAQFPTFDWGQYDQRTNSPNFATDNSSSAPDGILDYVIVCFRTGCNGGLPGSTGMAGVPYAVIPANGARRAYTISTGHSQAGGDLEYGTALHEMAHTIYNAPHLLGANGTTGNRYYNTYGWGMMNTVPTSYSANAWERWYLGWTELRTGANQANSDVQGAASLTATGGTYTLRDYVTTGDVMRLRIPGTSQYLWLENRAKNGPCDRRRSWDIAGDGLALKSAPTGLLGMIEDLGGRGTFLSPFDPNKVNGLRAVSAAGNFDYAPNGGLFAWNNHMWGNTSYNYFPSAPNATGGHSEITAIRGDRNNDNVINYDNFSGNGDRVRGNESTLLYAVNDQFTDGLLGPNIGTRQVGFRYALDSNPLIVPHQTFDATAERLSSIPLHGLSVTITGYDASTGDLTVQVRYNNTSVNRNTRWTGTLRTTPVANATNGREVFVNSGVTLTLDRSATPQRSSRGTGNDFVNDTELRVVTGTSLAMATAANLQLSGQGTTLYLESGASAFCGGGSSRLTANPGTTISVDKRSDLADNGSLVLRIGSKLIIRSTNTVINGTVARAAPQPVVYPNPSTGTATLAWPDAAPTDDLSGYRYALTDLQGHALRTGAVVAGNDVLTGLPAGLYLLLTQSPGGERRTQRLEVR